MSVVFNRDTYDLPLMLFEKLAVERSYAWWQHAAWRTSGAALDGLPDVAFRYTGSDQEQAARIEGNAAIALVALSRYGQVDTWVAGTDEAAVAEVLDAIRRVLTQAPDSADHEIAVRFWTMGPSEPNSVVRMVTVPLWSEVRLNYPSDIIAALDRLMERRDPPVGGQLMLWHGPPGTGKTHAIRALVREWRDWVDAEYVVDPEAFFGGSANYIMSLLLGSEEHEEVPKWRLLIFEDTGELLSADARERVGQGLSRLLNTVDGLLGQGLRVLLLMTTNDELGKLHPAVTRPGRCAVNLRFGPLDRHTAADWLARHGVTHDQRSGPATLADLFAVIEGNEGTPNTSRTIGFASRG